MLRQSDSTVLWTEPKLRERLLALCRQIVGDACTRTPQVRRAIMGMARLGMTPEMQQALQGRKDPPVALRELAVIYASGRVFDHPCEEQDPFCTALVLKTHIRMHEIAEALEPALGENPLEADPVLALNLSRSLSRYVPKRPMDAHIRYKLKHYESSVSRCMRQIENLVRTEAVTEAFVELVLASDLSDEQKAYLLNMARGGGRTGVDYEETILFFARPAVIEFVRRFAGTLQPARTLYAEEVYEGIEWHGKKAVPVTCRRNYLDPALAQVCRARMLSLDEPRRDGAVPLIEWVDPNRF